MNDYISLFLNIGNLKNELASMPGVDAQRQEVAQTSQSLYDSIVTDPSLRKVTHKLFHDGHHARAVEEAYKCLNNYVKKKSHTTTADGSGLMKSVFSAKAPKLKINVGESQSEIDEQIGYMEIFSGCMTGIRNPRAHEHEWEDTEERALQLLMMANHLFERARNSSFCE